MMKWKARKENLNIGSMELSNLTFNEDYMEISIDILNVSEELQAEINKLIEIAKAKTIEHWKEWWGEIYPYINTIFYIYSFCRHLFYYFLHF